MRIFFSFLVLFVCALSADLYAQDAPDTTKYETDEVVVTGTRVEQKIIDVPFSVARINQSQWITSRRMGVDDVIRNVPGVWFQPRYGNHDVRISIRGFGTRSNTGIRGVRILLDGIPESEPDGQTRIEALDFNAIGKIEIAKGNLTSLYTNAPGGVINFFTDKYFPTSFAMLDNEFGSYDMRKNGLKFGVTSDNQRFMASYSYENYKGYREHSQEYQNRFNSVYEVDVTNSSKLAIYGYYVNGIIKLPGSLTLKQYNEDDLKANPRDVSRDSKRITEKGRLAVTYNASFGKEKNNSVEMIVYGTIKNFNRTAATYRLFNRSGIGGQFRYINKSKFGKRTNEFSVGGDAFYQSGPISEFNNVGGQQGDQLQTLNDEVISNLGFYFLNNFPIVVDKVNLMITGRYDRIGFNFRDRLAQFRDTSRLFDKFAPKFALNYKINPFMAFYTSYGWGFDTPAGNELDNYPFSSDGGLHTINPDLNAQETNTFEIGYKGEIPNRKSNLFTKTFLELTYFNTKIDNAIVPFTVDGDPYFRNAASVTRNGVEFGFNTEVVKGLKWLGSYTYSDFVYNTYDAVSIDANGVLSSEKYDGNKEPSNPDHNINTELSYTGNFTKDITGYVKGYFNYVSSMFVNDKNVDSLKTDSYSLLGAQIGGNFQLGDFQIVAYAGVNNILDQKYVSFIQINSDRQEYYEAGARSNFFGGINIAYMFRRR
ncbi:MAG: TonB-dependent receptor [Ignavibacteria bacterium]|nr:TonB-dependent receptor [Ignavibacteria bacterium]